MPIPSGARYPGESESHRAARRAEAERVAEAERAALAEATAKPRHRRPAPRPAPTPTPEPTPEPAEPPRPTWRDLDATQINRF